MHDNNVPTNPKTDALKSKEKDYSSAVLRNTPATEKLNGQKNAVGLPLSRKPPEALPKRCRQKNVLCAEIFTTTAVCTTVALFLFCCLL